jgi:hypothetical protein
LNLVLKAANFSKLLDGFTPPPLQQNLDCA